MVGGWHLFILLGGVIDHKAKRELEGDWDGFHVRRVALIIPRHCFCGTSAAADYMLSQLPLIVYCQFQYAQNGDFARLSDSALGSRRVLRS